MGKENGPWSIQGKKWLRASLVVGISFFLLGFLLLFVSEVAGDVFLGVGAFLIVTYASLRQIGKKEAKK